MKSKEFKTILTIQIITLILVFILFINNLSNRSNSIESGVLAVKADNTSTSASTAVTIDTKNNYFFGASDAPNFLIVFSRYNCEYCRYFYNHVFDSLNNYYILTKKLKIICKDLINPNDRMGMLMAKVAEVGRQTNHFSEIHKLLIAGTEPPDSISVINLALRAGILESDIKLRLNSPQTLNTINEDNLAAKNLNITGTPSFVLNGKVFPGYMTFNDVASKLNVGSGENKGCKL
jgi:protein-disulfide isomerase